MSKTIFKVATSTDKEMFEKECNKLIVDGWMCHYKLNTTAVINGDMVLYSMLFSKQVHQEEKTKLQ